MTMNTSYRKLFSRSTAAGLGLLLVLVNLPVAEADVWVKRDWSRVQAVTPGTRTTVLLYKDQAPRGGRKIKGHFQSATAETVTLWLPHGLSRTAKKKTVRKILVYRPFKKRYQGWITAAVFAAVSVPRVAKYDDIGGAWGQLFFNGLFIGAPTAIAFLVAPKWGGIYNAPPDRRDNSNTKTKPSQQRSGATVPGVTEAGGGSTGSELADRFLTEPSGPERLRQQARQALVRKGIPLHLPNLPVHGLSAERAGTWGAGGAGRPAPPETGEEL